VGSWMFAGAEVSAKSIENLIGAGSDTLVAMTRFYDAAGVRLISRTIRRQGTLGKL
jgi:hypothetical protein